MKLIIVESPEKAEQLSRILGKGYEVWPCLGPVRQLALRELRMADGEFVERYETPREQDLVLAGVRKAAQQANFIYVATAPDREGDLLAWDIAECLPRRVHYKVRRLVIREITSAVVHDALNTAREIDMNGVDAARARRLLDHILVREISPLFEKWGMLPPSSSAPGLTEIAALRLAAEREMVRHSYDLAPIWTIEARLEHEGTRFDVAMDDTADIVTGEEATQVIERLMQLETDWMVERVERHEESDEAPAPFTNAALLVDAEAFLDLRPGEVQQAVMKLYEAGLVTYPITNSTSVAPASRQAARDAASKLFGEEYVAPEIALASGKENGQAEPEAIRPIDPFLLPDEVSIPEMGEYPAALYALIWQRFIASVMKPVRYEVTLLTIRPTWTGSVEPWEEARAYPHPVPFQARLRSLLDGGYTRIYSKPNDPASGDQELELPDIEAGDELTFVQIKSALEAAEILPRFTPASLVGMLTAMGIGSPLSRTSAVERLLALDWVAVERDELVSTPRGEDALFLYVEHFGEAFEVKAVSDLDLELDKVAQGQAERNRTTAVFVFTKIAPALEEARRAAGEPVEADPLSEIVLPKSKKDRKETA